MRKEEIFSKLKDYNNQLEKILEKKDFSEDAKSLLLSMLYKIENSYEDYSTVKVEVIPKSEFIQYIIKIIQNYCNQIEIDKTNTQVDINNKKIIIKPNEIELLKSLYRLKGNSFHINDEYKNIKEPMEEFLKYGDIMDKTEVIRDFDGWSWNILYSSIENKTYNLLYQNLKMLLGYDFMENWLKNAEEDYIEILQKKLMEISKSKGINLIYRYITQISILEYMKTDNKYWTNIVSRRDDIKIELEEIVDKKRYLQNIGEMKKRIAKDINNIDNIINNNDLAREEFNRRNEILDEKNKIFSLSELIEILQNEREKYVIALKKKNKLMEPMIYIQMKEELEEELALYKEIDLDNNNELKLQDIIIKLQKEFLRAFSEMIKKSKIKKEIVELIYKLRYYKTIPINEEITIRREPEILKDIKNLQKNLITKACNMNALEIISKNIEENYKIISEILDTKIAKLEDINILVKKKEKQTIINIYDDNILDNTLYYDNIEDLNLKTNKKIKLFI